MNEKLEDDTCNFFDERILMLINYLKSFSKIHEIIDELIICTSQNICDENVKLNIRSNKKMKILA